MTNSIVTISVHSHLEVDVQVIEISGSYTYIVLELHFSHTFGFGTLSRLMSVVVGTFTLVSRFSIDFYTRTHEDYKKQLRM